MSEEWRDWQGRIEELEAMIGQLVAACKMARADLMAWASHDSIDNREAVQARYANTPAILAIDAALATVKEGK